MRCPECRSEMEKSRENYRYDESGLDVVLVSMDILRCKECGGSCVAIPSIESLHETIAGSLIRKNGRLVGPDIRFLRTFIGWSGRDLAREMGVKPETVSRWENGKAQIGPFADVVLRMFVVSEKRVDEYTIREAMQDSFGLDTHGSS